MALSELDIKFLRMVYNMPEEHMLNCLRICLDNRNEFKEDGYHVYYGPTSPLAASYRKTAREWIKMLRTKRKLHSTATEDDVKKYKLDVPPTSDEF